MSSLFFVVQRLLLVICFFSCSLLSFAQQTPTYIWGRAISGKGYINLSYSAVDAPGNVYLAGVFGDSIDLDPGPDSFKLTTVGDYDAFVSKLDSAGNLGGPYNWVALVPTGQNM
jgi:hypothetical protein